MAEIYNHYVRETVITFEEDAVTADQMRARLAEVSEAELPWLVAVHNDAVVGYAYASKWKGRCAYRYSVETTVYVDKAHPGKGYGTRLYEALFDILRSKQMHIAIGGIALPNPVSVALHEKFGLEKVAHFPEVGFKQGRWVDVGYWQRRL
jgi:phosphinothricin acetyltransferase